MKCKVCGKKADMPFHTCSGTGGEFKIENKVPLPPGRKWKNRYPWNEMKIGDSFYVPKEAVNTDSTIRTAAAYFARRNPEYKFRVAVVEGGVRVWRVEPEKGKQ